MYWSKRPVTGGRYKAPLSDENYHNNDKICETSGSSANGIFIAFCSFQAL